MMADTLNTCISTDYNSPEGATFVVHVTSCTNIKIRKYIELGTSNESINLNIDLRNDSDARIEIYKLEDKDE